jgi:MYXO-CTERM domain-containing protein
VRGGEIPAAQVIERALTAGQSEVIEDRTDAIDDANAPGLADDEIGGSAGCACDASDGAPASTLALLALLTALGLRRRRV